MKNKSDINLKPVTVEFEAPRKRKVSAPLATRILRWSGGIMIAASLAIFGLATWEVVGSDITAGQNQDKLADQFAAQEAGVDTTGSLEVDEFIDDGSVSPALLVNDATFADPLFGVNQKPGVSVDEVTEVVSSVEPFERKDYGAVAGRIRIPSIDVDFYVSFGTDYNALTKGPGVWEYGVVPGNPGNATIAGHRTTYEGPFRHLDSLNPGDLIYFDTPGRETSVFEVRGSAVVLPDNVSVTYQTEGVRLTLTTCTPVGSTRERLIVQAELVEGEFSEFALDAADWLFQGEF